MKALTLTEPYASLIARGIKRIETRVWATSYRGPLAIHAAAGFAPLRAFGYPGTLSGMLAWVDRQPALLAACAAAGDGPRGPLVARRSLRVAPFVVTVGRIIAVAELVDCISTSDVPWVGQGQHEFFCGKDVPA